MLEVTILPEDFRAAPLGYIGPECVLKEALRRLFPRKNTFVGYRYVNLDGERYQIDLGQWGDGNLPDGFTAHAINEYSALAKQNLEGIPSKTLYLQPLSH
jgi:hypothetical protein